MKNELFRMYKYPAMIKAMAFCAASFAFLSVALKNGIVLIPDVSEVRICNALSCAYGIWFGPAGAWGVAIGNLIGDFGGSLSVLTPFGFAANFLSAWFPYKIWCAMGDALGESRQASPSLKSAKWGLRYAACGFVSVVSCCAFLSIWFDYYAYMPSAGTFFMLFCNNIAATAVGVVVYIVLSVLRPAGGFWWYSIMRDDLNPKAGKPFGRKAVNIILILSALVCVFFTVYLISFREQNIFAENYRNPLLYTVCSVYLFAACALGISCR